MRLSLWLGFVIFFIVSCGSYITPEKNFLEARIQFTVDAYNEKKITIVQFTEMVKKVVINSKETTIQGWKKESKFYLLITTIGNAQYAFQFTDIVTDTDGEKVVILTSVTKNDKTINVKDILELIVE